MFVAYYRVLALGNWVFLQNTRAARVQTLPKNGFWGGLRGLNPFSGGTWTLRDSYLRFFCHVSLLILVQSFIDRTTLPPPSTGRLFLARGGVETDYDTGVFQLVVPCGTLDHLRPKQPRYWLYFRDLRVNPSDASNPLRSKRRRPRLPSSCHIFHPASGREGSGTGGWARTLFVSLVLL